MRISEIGGEFALIRRLSERQRVKDPSIVRGVGDDCAVIDAGTGDYLLITSDMMVESSHFNTDWFTPEQIGKKLVECNVSDIVSMGGTPDYGTISMSLKKDTEVSFVDAFYDGVYAASARHDMSIVGGDTTHGSELVFGMTIVGHVNRSLLRTRALAKVGDAVCVTGSLGGSAAGLRVLKAGILGDTSRFLEPHARMADEGKTIAAHSHAMIDVSDGLASEVRHICEESSTGAIIYDSEIPMPDAAIAAGKALGTRPQDDALYGGEDYEIVFTATPAQLNALKKTYADYTVVGKIVPPSEGITLLREGIRIPLCGGYDHFL